jgi:hypothetical protein
MMGRPIFDYPPEFRAPEGEGCRTCGIVLENDQINGYCSPECCEWSDRCDGCQRGPTWCECEITHCLDCGDPLSEGDVEHRFRTCPSCAATRVLARDAAKANARTRSVSEEKS